MSEATLPEDWLDRIYALKQTFTAILAAADDLITEREGIRRARKARPHKKRKSWHI